MGGDVGSKWMDFRDSVINAMLRQGAEEGKGPVLPALWSPGFTPAGPAPAGGPAVTSDEQCPPPQPSGR